MALPVESWYEALPDQWRDRAQRVRELIMEASPSMREGWRYGTPFYDHHRWLCYVILQQGQLVLGFVQGMHLADPEGVLERTDHKVIRQYRPPPLPARLNEGALRRLIVEAMMLNEQLAPARTKKRKPS